jgi:hypothetical protein
MIFRRRKVVPTPAPSEDVDLRELARRTIARDTIELHTLVRSDAFGTIRARLADMSPYGCQARVAGALWEQGERIFVLLPLVGDIEARIMWGLKGLFGCKFDTPVDADIYPALLTTIRTDCLNWPDEDMLRQLDQLPRLQP